LVPVAGTLRMYEAAKPYYASAPERLGLRLYDHTHLVTEAEAADAIEWLLVHFAAPAAKQET